MGYFDTEREDFAEEQSSEQSRSHVPVWEKYAMTIAEAAAYFRVGEKRLRRVVNENPDADFVLWVGTRALIKRKLFENYLDKVNVL